jgi:hypothetical protein
MLEDRAIRILRNIPKKIVATLRHQGSAHIDHLMNRAMKAIEIISRSRAAPAKIDVYMEEAWKIYLRLQRLSGRVNHKFMDNTVDNPTRVIEMQRGRYSRVNWNSMVAPPKGHKKKDPYWNEAEAKPKPVKIYTKKEREELWKSLQKTYKNTPK